MKQLIGEIETRGTAKLAEHLKAIAYEDAEFAALLAMEIIDDIEENPEIYKKEDEAEIMGRYDIMISRARRQQAGITEYLQKARERLLQERLSRYTTDRI